MGAGEALVGGGGVAESGVDAAAGADEVGVVVVGTVGQRRTGLAQDLRWPGRACPLRVQLRDSTAARSIADGGLRSRCDRLDRLRAAGPQ